MDWEKESIEMSKLLAPGQRLELDISHTSDESKRVYILTVRDGPGEYGGPLADITDENLLARLRGIKGQFRDHNVPIFYYEYVGVPSDVEPREKVEEQDPRGAIWPRLLKELHQNRKTP